MEGESERERMEKERMERGERVEQRHNEWWRDRQRERWWGKHNKFLCAVFKTTRCGNSH